MNICLKDADKAGARTFLIATPAGSGLYRKLGFEEIDILSWDIGQYRSDGDVNWLCMMREPVVMEKI